MDELKEEVLISDFNQANEMLRHYDNVNWDITKFAFGEILVAIGACWTVWSVNGPSTWKLYVMAAICVASLLFGILALFVLAKNRVYFAKTARYVNTVRNYVVMDNSFSFEPPADYWIKTDFPKTIDFFSTQFASIYILTILNVLIAAAGSCFLMIAFDLCFYLPCGAVFLFLIIIIVMLFIVFKGK